MDKMTLNSNRVVYAAVQFNEKESLDSPEYGFFHRFNIIIQNPWKEVFAKGSCDIYTETIVFNELFINKFAKGGYTAEDAYEAYEKIKFKMTENLGYYRIDVTDDNKEAYDEVRDLMRMEKRERKLEEELRDLNKRFKKDRTS